MRRKTVVPFLVGLLALLLIQTARTQGTDVPFPNRTEEIRGVVTMVENNMLFMEANGVSYAFHVNEMTKVTVGNVVANLEALMARKGQPVMVKFRATSDGNMAEEIAVMPGMSLSMRERGGRMMHGMHHGMHGTCPMRGGTS